MKTTTTLPIGSDAGARCDFPVTYAFLHALSACDALGCAGDHVYDLAVFDAVARGDVDAAREEAARFHREDTERLARYFD